MAVGLMGVAWRRFTPRAEGARRAAPWLVGGASAGAVGWVLGTGLSTGVPLAVAWLLLSAALMILAGLADGHLTFFAGGALVFAVRALLGPDPEPLAFLVTFSALGGLLSTVELTPPMRAGGRLGAAGVGLAGAGVLAHVAMVAEGPLRTHMLAAGLLVLAANVAVVSARHAFEPGYYAAGAPVVGAIWVEAGTLSGPPAALFAAPAAAYLVACGYLYVRLAPEGSPAREFPRAVDAFAVAIGLGYPLLVALGAPASSALGEALGVVSLSLVAIGAGIVLKVRAYFFGGVVALAAVAFYRSFYAIAQYWWLVLGVVGVGLLAVALSWERQRMLVADTRERLRRSFEGWR